MRLRHRVKISTCFYHIPVFKEPGREVESLEGIHSYVYSPICMGTTHCTDRVFRGIEAVFLEIRGMLEISERAERS